LLKLIAAKFPGAQGEYARINGDSKSLHIDRGDLPQKYSFNSLICAWKTNPASAVDGGMKRVVVKCDERGNIDVAGTCQEKAEKHSKRIVCLMITYPSYSCVFESSVKDITKIIHQHGGQVIYGWC